MAFNKNELILDRVRQCSLLDLSTDELLVRLTSLEDPSLATSAEGEEVTDAVGALITTLYRAKRASFSATNSLLSMDLAAAQFGSKKEVADENNKILVRVNEIVKIPDGAATVTLKHTPAKPIAFIYSIMNNETDTKYASAAAASATEFMMGENGQITLPTGLTGKIYVEYEYESENALRVVNSASEFPSAVKAVIYAYFRDKCNENVVYSGAIICPKAKLNPEQVELALTSTGKHAFELTMMKDFCAEEGEDKLFEIVIFGE